MTISHRTSLIMASMGTVIMFILYYLTSSGTIGFNPVGQTSNYNSPLIVPAGYAFSIWGIIYTGLIAFPIFQWIRRREGHELWKPVRIWYAINVICNGIWLVLASYDLLWLSVVVILFMLFTLYQINSLTNQIRQSNNGINFWAEKIVFSMYFAWITLASVLNVSAALSYNQWDGAGVSQVNWTLIMLTVAAIIAGIVAYKYKDIGYAGVVIWAFIALVVKHASIHPTIAYLCYAVIAVFALLIITFSRDRYKVAQLSNA